MAAPSLEILEDVDPCRADIIKVLASTPVSSLKLKAKAVILNAKTEPKKAIEILVQNRVRAAPVVDGSQFVGVLDVRDTIGYALANYDIEKTKNKKSEQKQQAIEYLATSKPFSEKSLSELCKHRPFLTCKETDSLLDLTGLFAEGAHVVGIISEQKSELLSVVTQGYYFQQIAKLWKFKADCLLQRLLDLKYIISPVVSINRKERAYEAFNIMGSKDLSGLAVTNEEGVLVHNTSATDIKLWLLASHTLENSIEQFLVNIRKLSLIEKYPITVCQLRDTMKRAVQKLQATKYHRLWIVDNKTRPIGVLSLTDVFRFIVKYKEIDDSNVKDDKTKDNADNDDQKQE